MNENMGEGLGAITEFRDKRELKLDFAFADSLGANL